MNPAATAIVLVHGLWFGSWSLAMLARRLRHESLPTERFSYRTTSASVREHAQALSAFVRQRNVTTVHWVGHSLGGLVILRMLADDPGMPPGRVVLLGTPVRGSRVARTAAQIPGGAIAFGKVAQDLAEGCATLPLNREIGLIAGSKSIGLGRLLGAGKTPGDGTVALHEADAPGLAGRIVLPVSHTSMLFSRQVASQVSRFLVSGHFDGAADRRQSM